jgi:RND family efflux transporter MFP subunit
MRTRLLVLLLVAALVAGLAVLPRLTGKSYEDLANSGKTWFAASEPSGKGAGGPGKDAKPAQVSVSKPVQRPIIEWDEYTGRFDAVEAVEVRARISGYLDQVLFTDGQMVTKGDVLFRIDPRPFERALEQAKAELEQAKTRVSNAMLDVERGLPLVKTKAISQKVQDDRENIMRDARSAATIAEARVRTAELDLSFCQVFAPISGRISRKFVTPGNFISGGGAPDGTTILTTIVTQDPIYLYFDIGENDALKYRRLAEKGIRNAASVGATVGVALPDETGFPHPGKVDFLDNRLDAGTGTLRARANMVNKDGLFSAGMFARVRVQGSPEFTALLVPDEAIGTDQASRFVYVLGEGDVAKRKAVKLGALLDGLRVVREGLDPEDIVVVNGIQRVRAGQPVVPKHVPLRVSDAATGSVDRPAP